MSSTLLEAFIDEIERLVDPLAAAAESPRALEQLLAELGATQSASVSANEREALIGTLSAVLDLKSQLDLLANEQSPSLQSIAALLDVLHKAFTALRALNSVGETVSAFAGLGEDLVKYLVTIYLRRWHPLAHSLAVLATLIERVEELEPRLPVVQDDELVRDFFSVDRFHFRRLVDLVRDPATTLRAEYGNSLTTIDEANQLAQKLFPRLVRVLQALHVPCRYGFEPDDAELMGDAAPLVENALIIYADDPLAGAPAEAGVVLSLSPADRGDLGLVISPFGTLTTTKHFHGWAIELSCTAGVDVLAYGRHGLTLLAGPSTAEVDGRFSATLPAPEEGPAFVFGAPTGTRLEVGGAQLKLETALSEAQQALALSAAVSSSTLVITPEDGDSFLSRVLPAEGLRAKFDLGLGWSTERGFTFHGAAGLDATLPIGLSIGGVSVPTLHLSLQASDAGLLVEVSASVGVEIGPVRAVIDRVGLATAVTFPKDGGNLGVADLALDFKPPSGVGLVIDAGSVTGGGYLSHSGDQYTGAFELQIGDRLALKAIGLLTTRLPGGQPGFSLLIIISAEFQPIQLGWGFTLNAVGGLFGLNRTMVLEELRQSVRQHTLDTILFPKDPVARAPQIISDLQRMFPAAEGRSVFGPMLRIGWGTPTILTLDLALVLEWPAPVRLVILGRLRMVLPTEQQAIILLQVDAVGMIDFDTHEASFDASLVASRVASYTISGDLSLRLSWGDHGTFLLAAGGFNPRFQPPPSFPALNRLAISLLPGDNPEVRLAAYLAITSNTVQVGGRLDVYAAVDLWLLGTFSVEGFLEFDALFMWTQKGFEFIVDLNAAAAIKRNGHSLLAVFLHLTFSGPRPWHIEGEAGFSFGFMGRHTIHIPVHATWGRREPLPPLPPADPLPELLAALADPRNWRAELPPAGLRVVTLRQVHGLVGQVLVPAFGSLLVQQRVVPLETRISRFGNALLSSPTRYYLEEVSLNGVHAAWDAVPDTFARAQFVEMSDDEKLTHPSFEQFPAGVRFKIDGLEIGDSFVVQADYGYDDNLIDAGLGFAGPIEIEVPLPRLAPMRPAVVPAAELTPAVPSRASAPAAPLRFTLNPPAYVLATKANLQVQGQPEAPGAGTSFTQVMSVLQQLTTQDPRAPRLLQIIGIHERV